jgi:Kef-type K+ transport system membrane component KefB
MALLIAPLCVRMSGLEWTLRRLVGVLLVAQAGFHLVFMGLAPTHHTASPLLMATWHIVATAVSIVLLRYAERALAGLASRVTLRRVSTLLRPVYLPRRLPRPMAWRLATSNGPAWQRSPLPVRGPPAAA